MPPPRTNSRKRSPMPRSTSLSRISACLRTTEWPPSPPRGMSRPTRRSYSFPAPSERNARWKSLKNGATDYVLKDRRERLVSAVRRALRESQERADRRQTEEQVRIQATALEAAANGIFITGSERKNSLREQGVLRRLRPCPRRSDGQNPRLFKIRQTSAGILPGFVAKRAFGTGLAGRDDQSPQRRHAL